MEPEELILAWQAPDHMLNRRRWTVATVDVRSSPWVLQYLEGSEFSSWNSGAPLERAIALGFEGYPAFFRKARQYTFGVGVHEALMRRLPPRNRPDFQAYLQRFGFKNGENLSDAALLAYTEAKLPSDGFSLVGRLREELAVGDIVLDVAGARYQSFGEACPAKPGDELSLRKEPTNEHDQSAIEILWNGLRIGYVNRVQASTVAYWIDHRAIRITVQRVNGRVGSPKIYALLQVRPRKRLVAA